MNRHLDILSAMRAVPIPAPQERGPWTIRRQDWGTMFSRQHVLHRFMRATYGYDRYPELPCVTTALYRATENKDAFGECVMSDDPRELRRHLPIVLTARGRILITGLGLGCVVRGLLARSSVTHIDVVEIDAHIINMVAPSFAERRRLTIHHGDALTIPWPRSTSWDFAWHDVWSETPDTQVLHAQLIHCYEERADRQGAWGLPRWFHRLSRLSLLGAARRPA